MPKQLNTRIQNKYDFEAKWKLVENTYKPRKGEMIIYASEVDADGNTLSEAYVNKDQQTLPDDRKTAFTYARIKFGDGNTLLGNLPFVGA